MKLILTLTFSVLCLLPGRAQLLLLINDSNPSAVTITATGAVPAASSVGGASSYGIDLLNFFTSDESGNFTDTNTSNLATSYAGTDASPYIAAGADSYSSGGFLVGPALDLNVYAGSDGLGNNQQFTAATQNSPGLPAFTGSATFDLSAGFNGLGTNLPAPGTVGVIIAGTSFDLFLNSFPGATPVATPILGTYEVVPEPSAWMLTLLGGLVALTLFQSRKRLR